MADDQAAGGVGAITRTAAHATRAGLTRVLPALRIVNQPDGFDCPGCAWPEAPGHGRLEFCENGAKAISHEATTKRLDAEFFRTWKISALRESSHRWLEAQGRLTEPVILRKDSEHFEPLSWEAAFEHCAQALRALDSPDEAIFYTSGRTSNEAAFLYQLFVREFGTNNLPDCSNMCHESSSIGLGEVIGIGKGCVSLEDFERADLILVIGQNPGSNHPRMLTTLEQAARRGCHIVSINPLRERGLVRFKHPQHPLRMLGAGTSIAERFVQLKVGGDIALFKGIMREVLRLEDAAPGSVLDWGFIRAHTEGFESFRSQLEAERPETLVAQSGVDQEEIRELAALYARSERVIACWAMGLTQHRFGVHNVQEVNNLLMLRGNIGKPGAGPCPVRGHSNVQGDRTMGIWERPPAEFLDALEGEFGFTPPRQPGLNTVEAITALHSGRARFFFAMGGNFAVATPDTTYTEEALSKCPLTVHVATKLNRTHLLTGGESILLPCLGRTERDSQDTGRQFVTVEDSMACVHRSRGRLEPASESLRSEPAIVAGLARAALGSQSVVDWEALVADYDRIRDRIERCIPGFDDFNRRVRQPAGFILPRPPTERRFATPSGKALFADVPVPELTVPTGRLLMMTVRSHDQYNTTIYTDDDRYRGVHGDRRVVLLNADDMLELGIEPDTRMDITSHFAVTKGNDGNEESGEAEELTRSIRGFRAIPYDVPRGCAVTYFPEANPLVPVQHFAERSFTPAYKSVVISLAPSTAPID